VSDLLYVLEIAVAFGLVIFIHELGHFLAAKWCGVHVRKFAIGFGPPVLRWQPGETEYSIRPIPLGGYVDLAGEHPDVDEEYNPRALWRRPTWQRVLVFSAGVLMNAVLAVVLFTVAPIVGMQVPAPVIGDMVDGFPADEAGLQAGDRIVAIDGEKVLSFFDVQSEVGLSKAGTTFSVTIERPDEGGGQAERLIVRVKSVKSHMMPVIGIEPEQETRIAGLIERSLPAQAGLQVSDRILAVNGQPVETFRGVEQALESIPAGPLTLTIERDGEQQDLPVKPSELAVYEFGIQPPILVVSVTGDSPAEEAGIQAGDRIIAIEEKPWPTTETLIHTIKAAGAGNPVRLTLWREEPVFLWFGAEPKRVEVKAMPRILEGKDEPQIGIHMDGAAGRPLQIGHVDPEGPAGNLQEGDLILTVGQDEYHPRDWNDLIEELRGPEGKPVPLQIRRGEKTLTTELEPKAVPQERLTMGGVAVMPNYVPLPRILNPLVAMKRALSQTAVWFQRVYLNLRGFIRRDISHEAFGGPVMIVQISYSQASRGLGTFIHFWGMISVFLAFVNFLPIPPFDGGHVVFALVEKVKGSPVSLKVRTWIWTVAWAGLLVVFVLITWQDISRVITGF